VLNKIVCKYILPAAIGSMATPAFADPPSCRTAFDEPEFSMAAGCFIRDDNRLLVVRHRNSGKLGFPAGVTRSMESAQCVAHRETYEETGLDVMVHGMIRQFGNGFTLYRCELPDPGVTEVDELTVPESGAAEVSQVLWVDPTDTEPSDWRFARDYPIILELFDR